MKNSRQHRKGGFARTPAKIRSARINGARGGRPSRQPTPLVNPSTSDRLARHLAIAFISYLSNTSFQTTMKNYGHERPSEYWIALAQQVTHDYQTGRFGPG